MPTSAPGNNVHVPRPVRGPHWGPAAVRRAPGANGFTLIELLIVVAIVIVAASVVTLAMRDGNEARLEEEGARLTALLEMARAEARVAGTPVRWVPTAAGSSGVDPNVQFRFVGVTMQNLPTRWLDPGTTAQIVGSTMLVLGPDAILPPQRVVLSLADKRLELASDGLGPFAVAVPGGAGAPVSP